MSTVSFAITFADVPGFPAGSSVASQTLTITDPNGVATTQTLGATDTSATATLTVVGGYTATVQGVDASGNLLGSAASATFSISAPATISLSLPSALSATVA